MDRTYLFEYDIKAKELRVSLQLRIEEQAAIGEIAAQWSCLDFHMTKFVEQVCKHQLRTNPPKDFASDSFRKRKRIWKQVVEKALIEGSSEKEKMLRIIASAGSLQGERQKALHSFFEFDRENPDFIKGSSHKNPLGKPVRYNHKNLTRIAEKIATLNAHFLAWPDDFPEPVSGSSSRDGFPAKKFQGMHLPDQQNHQSNQAKPAIRRKSSPE